MNKSEIIKEVAKRTGVPIAEAKKIVEATLDVISEHVKLGENVKLSGFGTFRTQRRVGVTSTRQKDRNKRHVTAGKRGRRERHAKAVGKAKAVFSPGSRLKEIAVAASEKTGDPGEFITKGKK